MKMTELFLSELEREVRRSRHALEQVPEGKHDWKPHEKSMIFGYLADIVATIPNVDRDDHQAGRARHRAEGRTNTDARADEHERGIPGGARQGGRRSRAPRLQGTTAHLTYLMAPSGGRSGCHGAAASRDAPRHAQPLGAPPRAYDRLPAPDGPRVPALYGPWADDKSFG